MAVSLDRPGLRPSVMQRVRRLRAFADECRGTVRALLSRPERERMLKMAQQHDAEADQLEEAATLKG